MQENDQKIIAIRREVLLEKIAATVKDLKETVELLDNLIKEPVLDIQTIKQYCSFASCLFSEFKALNYKKIILIKNDNKTSENNIENEVNVLTNRFKAQQERITKLESKKLPISYASMQKMQNQLIKMKKDYSSFGKEIQKILAMDILSGGLKFKEFEELYLRTKKDLNLLKNEFNTKDFSLHKELAANIEKQITSYKKTELIIDKLVLHFNTLRQIQSGAVQQKLIQQEEIEKAREERRNGALEVDNANKDTLQEEPLGKNIVYGPLPQDFSLLPKIADNPEKVHDSFFYGPFLSRHKKHRSTTDCELPKSREMWDRIYNHSS